MNNKGQLLYVILLASIDYDDYKA